MLPKLLKIQTWTITLQFTLSLYLVRHDSVWLPSDPVIYRLYSVTE